MVNKGAIKVTNAQIDQLISNAHISKLCGRTLPPFSHAPAHISERASGQKGLIIFSREGGMHKELVKVRAESRGRKRRKDAYGLCI